MRFWPVVGEGWSIPFGFAWTLAFAAGTEATGLGVGDGEGKWVPVEVVMPLTWALLFTRGFLGPEPLTRRDPFFVLDGAGVVRKKDPFHKNDREHRNMLYSPIRECWLKRSTSMDISDSSTSRGRSNGAEATFSSAGSSKSTSILVSSSCSSCSVVV